MREKEGRGGDGETHKKGDGETHNFWDRQTDRQTEVHIEVVPT